ncbi:general secretion pathway protein [Sphingopyxis sp. HIX]|nr:general secretion pathway protein [Sphingopyxis sp. HIX]
MYDQFYGFTGRPFQLTPDPAFYFESGTHRKAMSYLGYGLAQGEGFIVITGDVGAGKTTLVGHLMNTIDPNRLTAVKLVSTQVEGDDLLRLVAEQFGLAWEGESKAELLRSMEQYLREQARAGRRTLLIVDEGQNLAISALEELRMLSNFQLGGHSLLQIFLLGQPEFRQTLFHSPQLEQLRQRVIATHHLDPMDPEEVEPYILHRLGKVGWTGNPSFSPDAFEEIFDHSEGVPRKLNVLVSRLLLFGAVEQLNRITGHHVRAVVAEVEADRGIDAATLVPPPVAPAPVAPPAPVASLAPVAVAVPEPEPEPEPVVEAAPEPAPAPFAAPVEAEAPLEWPARSVEPVAAPEPEPSPLAPPPFAAPAASLGLDRLSRRAVPEEVEALPPSHNASFVEARSLVAEQLGLAPAAPAAEPAPFAAPAPAFEPVAEAAEEEALELGAFEAEAEVEPVLEVEAVAEAEPAADAAPVPEAEPAAAVPIDEAHLVALQRQIAGLEARIADQDAALRRVLDLLIDWVERDPAGSPDPALSQGWAA